MLLTVKGTAKERLVNHEVIDFGCDGFHRKLLNSLPAETEGPTRDSYPPGPKLSAGTNGNTIRNIATAIIKVISLLKFLYSFFIFCSYLPLIYIFLKISI